MFHGLNNLSDLRRLYDEDLRKNNFILPTVNIIRPDQVNIYGATIYEQTMIAPFVEIQSGVVIGKRCRISSHTFICTGVVIEDDVFIGHGVTFSNDLFPIANNKDFEMQKTVVKAGASIGNGAVILPGITIGECSLIGAGAVVTKSMPSGSIARGNPALIYCRATGLELEVS